MFEILKGSDSMNLKPIFVIGISSLLVLSACSKDKDNSEVISGKEDITLIQEGDATVKEVTLDGTALIEDVKSYGKDIATIMAKAYFIHDDLSEAEQELSKEIAATSSLSKYITYIRDSNNFKDPYIVKEIRYNEESEKVFTKDDYYYYQITFEADVKSGIRALQIDDTFSLQIGQKETGEFYVNDFIHIDGHSVEGSGPELTEETFESILKDKVTKVIQYSDTFETTDIFQATSALKSDFQFEGDISDTLNNESYQKGVKKELKGVYFDDSRSLWAYANVSDAIIEETLNGQVPEQYIGEFGIKYDEAGTVGEQKKAYDFKMIVYQPEAENGDYTYKIWKMEMNEIDTFSWESFE